MAILNGKRLYGSGKLADVALEDDRAAAEYAWLMAGVSDDFGRFKVSPRRILGRAYEHRPAVNELVIGDWLALYEKHGLIKLYVSGGTTYAEWTNYMGDPPSQRHFHTCPEPDWSTHKHNKECIFREDVSGTQRPTRPGRKLPTSLATPSPTPPLLAVTAVRSVPAVPPKEQRTTDGAAVAAVVPTRPRATWLTRPGEMWRERWGDDSEPPFGEMGREFSKPVKAFSARGELDELWARWGRFLAAAGTSQWARPARFVQGLGEWAEGVKRPTTGAPTVGERAMAESQKFIDAARRGGSR